MAVEYDHHPEIHTAAGAIAALRAIFRDRTIARTVLDIGCGTGTWLRAAIDLGAEKVLGVDGVDIPQDAMHVSKQFIRTENLAAPLNLGVQRFELAICLEVAEHLSPDAAAPLIGTLCKHAPTILFSAAIPGQPGQHHINCQWPDYWQRLFNSHGFACSDDCRWLIWDIPEVEPWYRQNIFIANEAPNMAGTELRIRSGVHPRVLEHFLLVGRSQGRSAAHARFWNGGVSPL